MAQDWSKKFYNSKAWRTCKNAYIAKRMLIDGGACEVCGKEQGYIVHHKILLTKMNVNDPSISLNHCHLRYECKACHDMEEGHWLDQHGFRKPKCLFDSNGNPIPPPSSDE